jgi:PadR family transcriptional regulator PadR
MTSEERLLSSSSKEHSTLMVLRILATIGPQHAYAIATRLPQVSDDLLNLNQGTLYPALVRLEQKLLTEESS